MSMLQTSTFNSVILYMSKKVFTIKIDKKLIGVKELMDWAHVRHVPVVNDKDEVVGMVSHRDLLAASVSSIGDRISDFDRTQQLRTIPLEAVMHSPVTTISPTDSIQDAARLMRGRKIGCLPVVDKGKLIGILTDYDLLKIVEEM
ncbi:MAG: CBS domain-containing protein [Nitrospiria bacterium]